MQAKTLLSSSAALVVVLFLFVVVMPHCRSSASRLARRARALDRGFIVPCDGARHVLVPHALQLRVKAITHSLNLHDKHDTLAGTRSHFARLASVAAYRGEHISLGELNIASKSHQRANSAKHGGHDSRDRAAHCRKWADVDDGGSSQAGSVPAAPCRDTPSVDADLGCPATPLLGVPGGASGCADVASPAAMPWCFFAKFEMLIDRLLDKMDVTIPLLSDSKVPEVKVPSTTSEALVPTPVSLTVEFNNLKAEVTELQMQLKRTSEHKIEDLVITLDTMKAEVAKVQVQLKRTGEGHKNLLVQVGDLVRESSNSILEKVVELNEASHTQKDSEVVCSAPVVLPVPAASWPCAATSTTSCMEALPVSGLPFVGVASQTAPRKAWFQERSKFIGRQLPSAASCLGVATDKGGQQVPGRAVARKEWFQKMSKVNGGPSAPVDFSSVPWENDDGTLVAAVRAAPPSGCDGSVGSAVRAAPEASVPVVLLGATVCLFGLKTTVLNGQFGIVVELIGDRAGVLVDGRPSPIAIKLVNLRILKLPEDDDWGDEDDWDYPAGAEALAEFFRDADLSRDPGLPVRRG